jgi:hypothetical protein
MKVDMFYVGPRDSLRVRGTLSQITRHWNSGCPVLFILSSPEVSKLYATEES